MYLLNGTPISPDAQFESDGVLYPAGWIRLATPEEQEAAGVTWVDDEPRPDDFYAYVSADPAEPWKWIAVPYTPEEMKPRLTAYSRQQREWRELAGIEQIIGTETFHIPTDVSTRRTFFDYRVTVERPGAPVQTPHDFGSTVMMLAEPVVLSIEMKMESRVTGCLNTQLNLQQQIQAGTVTTKEQIDAAYGAVP